MNPLAVGSNVTLNLVPQSPINIGTWSYETTVIVICYPGGSSVSTHYQGRVSFNHSSSELSINSLQLHDSGLYTFQGMEPVLKAVLALSVQGKELTSACLANATDLVELNDTAIFTCSVSSGTSLSYRWLNGSSEVTASDRVRLSGGNSTLTIVSVTRYDEGPFRCEVINGISNGTSQPIGLNVSYGPERPIITGPALGETGHRVTFNCWASSQPPSQFSWFFNGSQLVTGSVYETGLLTLASHLEYTCVAFNNITGRNSTVSKILTVVGESWSNLSISTGGNQAIEGDCFTMTCNIVGDPSSIHWWKNRTLVHLDNRTRVSFDNRTLTFNPVQHSDYGEYQCMALNSVSNRTSNRYTLLVNYGPKQPVIAGAPIAETDQRVTFNCSDSSQPPSQFSWFFNGSQVATGSVYKTGPLTLASHGEYTCVAFNNITGRNSTVSKMLTVVGKSDYRFPEIVLMHKTLISLKCCAHICLYPC
uniref:Ig-like domain-containing protein n=1 Tax=Hucho hucho TaxID=62062 RepID=A0A4W5QKG0_9TELE